ncbi:MAG: hypothetical protein ACKOXO_01245 [Cyanobium sp.]
MRLSTNSDLTIREPTRLYQRLNGVLASPYFVEKSKLPPYLAEIEIDGQIRGLRPVTASRIQLSEIDILSGESPSSLHILLAALGRGKGSAGLIVDGLRIITGYTFSAGTHPELFNASATPEALKLLANFGFGSMKNTSLHARQGMDRINLRFFQYKAIINPAFRAKSPTMDIHQEFAAIKRSGNTEIIERDFRRSSVGRPSTGGGANAISFRTVPGLELQASGSGESGAVATTPAPFFDALELVVNQTVAEDYESASLQRCPGSSLLSVELEPTPAPSPESRRDCEATR